MCVVAKFDRPVMTLCGKQDIKTSYQLTTPQKKNHQQQQQQQILAAISAEFPPNVVAL